MSRRAVKVKSEICDAEGLGHKLENKDSELKELKRQLKLKVRSLNVRFTGGGSQQEFG